MARTYGEPAENYTRRKTRIERKREGKNRIWWKKRDFEPFANYLECDECTSKSNQFVWSKSSAIDWCGSGNCATIAPRRHLQHMRWLVDDDDPFVLWISRETGAKYILSISTNSVIIHWGDDECGLAVDRNVVRWRLRLIDRVDVNAEYLLFLWQKSECDSQTCAINLRKNKPGENPTVCERVCSTVAEVSVRPQNKLFAIDSINEFIEFDMQH